MLSTWLSLWVCWYTIARKICLVIHFPLLLRGGFWQPLPKDRELMNEKLDANIAWSRASRRRKNCEIPAFIHYTCKLFNWDSAWFSITLKYSTRALFITHYCTFRSKKLCISRPQTLFWHITFINCIFINRQLYSFFKQITILF